MTGCESGKYCRDKQAFRSIFLNLLFDELGSPGGETLNV